MSAWLLIGLVWLALWAFWLWLTIVFDAISEYHRARREDAKATRGTGSSDW